MVQPSFPCHCTQVAISPAWAPTQQEDTLNSAFTVAEIVRTGKRMCGFALADAMMCKRSITPPSECNGQTHSLNSQIYL